MMVRSECKTSSPLGFLPPSSSAKPHPAPAADSPPALAHHGISPSPGLLLPSPPQTPFSIHHPPAPLPVPYRAPIRSDLPQKPSESSATPALPLQSIRTAARASPAPCGGNPVEKIDIPFVDCAHIQVRRVLCSAPAPVSPFRRMTRRLSGARAASVSDPCDLRGDNIAWRIRDIRYSWRAVQTMVHASAMRSSSPSSAYSLPTKLVNVAPML
ncbi:hypothetical protein B0H11DRAFT_2096180 [Mycena galericulata]|nr:hypothetical protein B0H11DRAFT_2096180 [Mycena galericulata]